MNVSRTMRIKSAVRATDRISLPLPFPLLAPVMIPGMSKITKDVEISDDAFKNIEAIIGSMTPYERRHPSVLNGSRKMRIAAGSGNTIQEVNRLIKQFEDTRKMMKMVSNKGSKSLQNFTRRKR